MRDVSTQQRRRPHQICHVLPWSQRNIRRHKGRAWQLSRASLLAGAAANLLLPLFGTVALAAQRPPDLETNPNYPRPAVELAVAAEKLDILTDACAVQLQTLEEGPECERFMQGMLLFGSLRSSHAPQIDKICPPGSACRASNAGFFAYLDALLTEVRVKADQTVKTIVLMSYGFRPSASD